MRQGVNFLWIWIVKNIMNRAVSSSSLFLCIVDLEMTTFFALKKSKWFTYNFVERINFTNLCYLIFQVSKGRQNTAVKEQLYKSPVKKEQSSIWSEPIMADFPYPFVMRKALLIGVSIVWNHGLWESSMQGNLSHKIFFKTCMGFYYYSMCNKYKIR